MDKNSDTILHMFIIDCLPFSKGLKKDILSYFSLKPVEIGSLIKISVRNKNIFGLVVNCRQGLELKSEIKKADFKMKKLFSIASKPFLQPEFVEAIKETSEYFAAPPGEILSYFIPNFLLNNPDFLSLKKNGLQKNSDKKGKFKIEVVQCGEDERFEQYRSIIRESFAQKKSVFLCLSQNESVLDAKIKLEKGIESFVIALHKDMSKKEIRGSWKEALTKKGPVLIIATSSFLLIPREDIGKIIIDKENGSGWKTLFRPFIDLRFFAEKLAAKKDVGLILGDSFLRIETLRRIEESEPNEFKKIKWRTTEQIKNAVIDLKEETKKEKEFNVLSKHAIQKIEEYTNKKENVFIFALRKGLSPTVVCRDCGEPVKCFNCNSPMVLYKTDKKSGGIFRCNQCDETRDAAELCQNCRSWRLAPFGAGVDKVYEEVKKKFGEIKIFEINSDKINSSAKARKITEEFYKEKGAVMIGTEMALNYLHKKIPLSILASFDSLFSIPDFQIREKIFNIILNAKNKTSKEILIQSRNNKDSVIDFAVLGNLLDFYREEMGDRKNLNYPPFGVFIKITARGTKNFTNRAKEELKKTLSDYNPIFFPSNTEKKGEQSALNAIIKLEKQSWPNTNLFEVLKSLAPHFEIKVDPDNLL